MNEHKDHGRDAPDDERTATGRTMIEMNIKGLMVDPVTNMPIILLRDSDGQKVLPIWVGVFEANAIALQIENITPQRPMTHDLMRDILGELGVNVERIVISDLVDQTFFATIRMAAGSSTPEVSSRPSDAIALAVRLNTPIYAAEEVLDQAGIELRDDEETEVQKFREFLDQVSPEDFAAGNG